jgi:hypothetical protein
MKKNDRARMPSRPAIVKAMRGLLDSLDKTASLDDATRARTCWACGYNFRKGSPARAHVVPHSSGARIDDAGNYWLLCDVCHAEQPDGLGPQVQEVWLRGHEDWFKISQRNLKPFFTAMLETIGGDEEVAFEWWGSVDARAVYDAGAARAAGAKNRKACGRWALVESLRAFVRERAAKPVGPCPESP